MSEVFWGLAGTLGTGTAWRDREITRETDRQTEAMSIYETVKTQKWYSLCNTRSTYFLRERERLCALVK